MMRRREFIAGLGAAAWPVVARAQRTALPVIGFLGASTMEAIREPIEAFRRGLAETGYVEGQNVAIEYRWAEDDYDRTGSSSGRFDRDSGQYTTRAYRQSCDPNNPDCFSDRRQSGHVRTRQ